MNQLVIGRLKGYLHARMETLREMGIEEESERKVLVSPFTHKANALQDVLNEIARIEAEVITGKEIKA